MTPAEQLAEAILSAAGSSLRHYTPQSRIAIIAAAEAQIAALRPTGGLTAHLDDQRHGIGGRGE
ncbi:hypothetical protein [Paracoccus sp. 22332]|uniref:hypothetical protein n=1 Tax=Paracoccus sp. 22332 TaxID=3453913 RepID=UPI003F84ABD2